MSEDQSKKYKKPPNKYITVDTGFFSITIRDDSADSIEELKPLADDLIETAEASVRRLDDDNAPEGMHQ